MSKIINKVVPLKEFVDFAISLKEMDEVKNGFPVPKSITYFLGKANHESIQKEILKEKNMPLYDFVDDFEVELYGINFKFIVK
jgi:hypothetical protein